ncbi:efflux RND transporter periplasmic adaptor subunit [Gallaecimonas pentaromativorans]|uniref:RND family efflux transporter MFP subunit n=1 Tax=Gallaecimonas pentaromativorans TaxID=584787 RepID=A0A3N1PQQ0_9GAMM|nr:efflux RND transporter periplasmic adaptor subunit [Gallaecimonas pentaromativorans]ROQ30539.1 RND family efflux transporter MFP subunit [Gallaecimonas pentaromativorans]
MFRRQFVSSVFCLLPLALTACGDARSSDPRTEAPRVRVEAVQAASAQARAFTGVVAARVQSDLGFRVSGKVLERLVETGQKVKGGQPLMRIDPSDLSLQVQAQQQAVAAARARARQMSDDEARYRDLVAKGTVSVSAYDQAKAAADSARAQLKAAEAQADVAKNASSYAVLLADADGVVVDTLAEPGQVVSAGQTVVRLARAGQREAAVYLPETLRPAIGSKAQATLYGAQQTAVPATLRLLSDAADPVTRTYEARYVLSGALANAPLGATVTVDIPRSAPAALSFMVPVGALLDQGNGPGVWVIEGNPSKVVWRAVQVLDLTDATALVQGSFKAGEQVVSLGAHLLHDGEPVKPLEHASTAAGARL